jgi:hypothetical protein
VIQIIEKRFICLKLVPLIFLISNITLAQESDTIKNKAIYQLNPGLSIPYSLAKDHENIGASMEGAFYFPSSHSFKFGFSASYQMNIGKAVSENFNVGRLNFDVMLFPVLFAKRINKSRKYSKDYDNFYMGIGMGHGLSHFLRNDVFNNVNEYIGYQIPLKNKRVINLKISYWGYILEKKEDIDPILYRFINPSVGYVFR